MRCYNNIDNPCEFNDKKCGMVSYNTVVWLTYTHNRNHGNFHVRTFYPQMLSRTSDIFPLQVMALTECLEFPLKIIYVDRSPGPPTEIKFPDSSDPKVVLIYRPGHYDILYK